MQAPPPYRPLRGAQPPHFADRADEDDLGTSGVLASTLAAYRAGPADARFARLVYGPPAIGKTALWRAVRREAACLGWAVAGHRCRHRETVLAPLFAAVMDCAQRHWGEEIGRWVCQSRHPSVAASDEPGRPAGGGVDAFVPGGRRDSVPVGPRGEGLWGSLRRLLVLLGQLSAGRGSGVLVAIDDAHQLVAGELAAVAHLARALSASGLPVAFLLTGLPELEVRAARAGYFESVLWPTRLHPLSAGEASEAVVVPAAERGVEIDDDAVDLITQTSGGWPLDVQKLAFAAWSLAEARRPITRRHVEGALALACGRGLLSKAS